MGTPFTIGIAPRGESTRDVRGEFLADTEWSSLRLPAPLFYQPDNKPAHQDAVLVGRINAVELGDDMVTGAGEMLDDHPGLERLQPVIAEAMTLAREGVVAPSVDPSVMEFDLDEDTGAASIIRADIAGVTLVSSPAFANTWIRLADQASEPGPDAVPVDADEDADAVLIAAVQELVPEWPIAAVDHEWNAEAAAGRIADHCGVVDGDDDNGPWACYGGAFLYRDDEVDTHALAAYRLGVADVVDGELTLIPAAVTAAAELVDAGDDIPADAVDDLKTTITTLYERINDAHDAGLTPPWDATESTEDDEAGDVDEGIAALIAAHVVEPVPADAFAEPELDGYRPGFTVERGRIVGHLTHRDACYRGIAACVTPPESASGYAMARRYKVDTDAGPLDVARFTSGLGTVGPGCSCHDGRLIDDHYCPADRSAAAAIAHHDGLHTLADIVIGESESGAVWLAGVVRDGLPDGAARVLDRGVLSGDWRPWGAGAELVEVLALNHAEPGFTSRTRHDGAAYTLIAAAGPLQPATAAPSPGDHIRAAVRAELDAREVRRGLAAAAARADLAAITH